MAGTFRNQLQRLKGQQASITFDSSAKVGKVLDVGDNYVVLEVVEAGQTESLLIPIAFVSCAKAVQAPA